MQQRAASESSLSASSAWVQKRNPGGMRDPSSVSRLRYIPPWLYFRVGKRCTSRRVSNGSPRVPAIGNVRRR